MNFGAGNLASSVATFGGQINPYCNYTSQYAKGFVYREMNKYPTPMRPTIFRLKVRTAAEIRFSEIVKRYMADKLTGARQQYMCATGNPVMIDHMNSIIPKDEYEVKKLTSYMMTRKASDEFRKTVIHNWVTLLFTCEAHNMAGHVENSWHQQARIATEEEFMQYLWFIILSTGVFAAIVTALYWYWKYGQGYEVIPVH